MWNCLLHKENILSEEKKNVVIIINSLSNICIFNLHDCAQQHDSFHASVGKFVRNLY